VKILVVGLGSIGQRHVRNLRALLGDRVEILAHRVRGLDGVITEGMAVEAGSSVTAKYGVTPFDRLETALAQRPDAVFVCNPTSEHLSTALAAVHAGCHVFVEKPLSHSPDGIDELIAAADAAQRVVAVGYQMRRHPALLRTRALLQQRAIGRMISVRAEMGEYLPDAHPYEDYRTSYAARADLGGGVLRCYIHEFDYLCWLFGLPRRVFAVGGRLGNLEIDVEDTALTTLEVVVDGRLVVMQAHHTFLQRPSSRTCEIVGEDGTLRIDFLAASLVVTTPQGVVEQRSFAGHPRNQLFIDELNGFLAAMAGDRAGIVTAREAVESLRVALAARQSLATGQVVDL